MLQQRLDWIGGVRSGAGWVERAFALWGVEVRMRGCDIVVAEWCCVPDLIIAGV
jgi:hypothetical protein